MPKSRRILSIAHSYCVPLNRRLAHELARAGSGAWEVTAVAPEFFHADLGPIRFERDAGEPCRLECVSVRNSRRAHVMTYGARLREILREPWDVVHCWEEPYILAGGQVALSAPRDAALVFYTFQNIAKRYPPPFSWIERYCLSRCAGWLAAGRSVVEALLPRGYGRKPHQVAPLGVDTAAFRPDAGMRAEALRRIEWTGAGPPVVGFLGRFVPEKGLRLLMRALDAAQAPWRALVVGGGPLERDLREWARGREDRIRVVTGVSHAEAPLYVNAMDLMCAPSQTGERWREQFGRMLIEAFACGVAVIASDSGEIPHVAGSAAWIAGERDERGWAEAIGCLLENPSRRAELASRGLDRARTEYAWPVVARRHLKFFERIARN
jgi:glycosyltransferase involved in cell wall biosynthesis